MRCFVVVRIGRLLTIWEFFQSNVWWRTGLAISDEAYIETNEVGVGEHPTTDKVRRAEDWRLQGRKCATSWKCAGFVDRAMNAPLGKGRINPHLRQSAWNGSIFGPGSRRICAPGPGETMTGTNMPLHDLTRSRNSFRWSYGMIAAVIVMPGQSKRGI
jgi:hypothetical protein